MNPRVEIGKRIKRLRQEKKFSQTQVAEVLFISQAAYSLIESSQNGIVADHIIKLSKLYDVSTDFILTGSKNLIRISRDAGFVPLLRTHAHAGFLQNISDDNFFDVKDWFRIPGFDPTKEQTLFEVEGDSMSPTIFAGDILICQLHHNLDNVLDGSAVVIITVDGVLVKRLRKAESSDYLLMENDNQTQDQSAKVNKDDIKKLLIIRGKISSVLVPHHEMTGKGKIQNLEESIDLLKKELYKMNKKLNALTQRNKY